MAEQRKRLNAKLKKQISDMVDQYVEPGQEPGQDAGIRKLRGLLVREVSVYSDAAYPIRNPGKKIKEFYADCFADNRDFVLSFSPKENIHTLLNHHNEEWSRITPGLSRDVYDGKLGRYPYLVLQKVQTRVAELWWEYLRQKGGVAEEKDPKNALYMRLTIGIAAYEILVRHTFLELMDTLEIGEKPDGADEAALRQKLEKIYGSTVYQMMEETEKDLLELNLEAVGEERQAVQREMERLVKKHRQCTEYVLLSCWQLRDILSHQNHVYAMLRMKAMIECFGYLKLGGEPGSVNPQYENDRSFYRPIAEQINRGLKEGSFVPCMSEKHNLSVLQQRLLRVCKEENLLPSAGDSVNAENAAETVSSYLKILQKDFILGTNPELQWKKESDGLAEQLSAPFWHALPKMIDLSMGEQEMKVYCLTVNEAGVVFDGCIEEIENTKEAMQRFVGGTMKVLPLTSEVVCILNEDGKKQSLPMNRALVADGGIQDILAGDILCCRKRDGAFLPIQTEDIPVIKEHLRPVFNLQGQVLIRQEE